MSDLSHPSHLVSQLKALAGQQPYHVVVPGTANTTMLSVVSFEAVETLGEPYRVTIRLTHPQELQRTDYLGKNASFRITPSVIDTIAAITDDANDKPQERIFSGCITHFNKLRQTHDFHSYEVVIEPLVARLRLTHASRIFQEKTAPEIIEAILRKHDLDDNQFRFKTRRTYAQHAFRLQYQMNDWDYIHLLMQQEGLYSYFMPGKFGDIIVFADDIDHYLYLPELKVPYRETAGLEANTETVFHLQTRSQTVAASYQVADYHPADAWDRFKDEANIAYSDKTTYGQSYVYGSHHLNGEQAKWEAQLRHEAAIAGQIIYTGESNVLELRPARVLRMDQSLPEAPNGQTVISVTHSGARDVAYKNSYTAIPSDRRFRLPLDEANWPKIAGTLSARVTSPNKYPHAYLTKDGHYTVRFDLDLDEWNPGVESVPLRLAKPFAGANQTGFHFPIINGTEAAIAFTDGNPNKPYIAHLHHNSRQPDHINNEDRWLSRNVIRTQSNNKLRMEDWKGQEHVKLATEHGKSQLSLGHLVDNRRQERGAGFELRTDGHGAIRGGGGLFLSADVQAKATGSQLEMNPAQSLLQRLHAQAQGLAQAATVAKAEVADLRQQNDWLRNSVAELKEAVLLLSSPAGIAAATPSNINLSAGSDIMQHSGADHSISVGKRFLLAAGQGLSMFAHKIGIKLIAAQGKVQIQAQSDNLELIGQQDVQITSAAGKTVVNAANGVVLYGGGSAYIKVLGDDVEIGGGGNLNLKICNVAKEGPAALSLPLPAFQQKVIPQSDRYVLMHGYTQRPASNRDYRIRLADGTIVTGTTDDHGLTSLTKSEVARGITLLTERFKEG